MGLHVSHDCWTGSYSSFHTFRRALGEVAGYGHLDVSRHDVRWDEIPETDPLRSLLAHSDCDDELAVEVLLPLAERLESLVPALRERDEASSGSTSSWHAAAAETFAEGLRRADDLGDVVVFC